MEASVFKKIFNEISKKSGFQKIFTDWCKESEECIVMLNLQKSNFENLYYLNIKIFIHEIFGNIYLKDKNLLKDTGDIFLRQPVEYKNIFDLNSSINDKDRRKKIEDLFIEYIIPLVNSLLTKKGIIEKHQKEGLFLLPNIKKELGI